MRSRVFDFEEQAIKGAAATEILTKVFSQREGFMVIPSTQHHDHRQGIDCFLIKRDDGRVVIRVDFKLDAPAVRTGNLMLEHVSQLVGAKLKPVGPGMPPTIIGGTVRAQGWAHTTKADQVISFCPGLHTAFCLSVPVMRENWPLIERFPLWPILNRDYITTNYASPIDWLEQRRIVVNKVSTAEPVKEVKESPDVQTSRGYDRGKWIIDAVGQSTIDRLKEMHKTRGRGR